MRVGIQEGDPVLTSAQHGIAVEADVFICKISELKYVNMSASDIDVRKKKKFGFTESCFERKHQLVLLCSDPDCKLMLMLLNPFLLYNFIPMEL